MQELTLNQQLANTLFLKRTMRKVEEQFKKGQEKMPVYEFDMNLRLLYTGDAINLEVLSKGDLGDYFKPIGFYDKMMNIYVINEFNYDLEELNFNEELISKSIVNPINLAENAIIGAFSIEVISLVLKILDDVKANCFKSEFKDGKLVPPNLKYDRQLEINGLKSELIMSFEAYPQFYLDDKYGLSSMVAAYIPSENELNLHPGKELQELYNRCLQMKLLSAYKTI
jgi:hypothetical protein